MINCQDFYIIFFSFCPDIYDIICAFLSLPRFLLQSHKNHLLLYIHPIPHHQVFQIFHYHCFHQAFPDDFYFQNIQLLRVPRILWLSFFILESSILYRSPLFTSKSRPAFVPSPMPCPSAPNFYHSCNML